MTAKENYAWILNFDQLSDDIQLYTAEVEHAAIQHCISYNIHSRSHT